MPEVGEGGGVLQGALGLAAAAGIGLILVTLILLLRSRASRDIGAAEIVFGVLPIAIWLLLSGHVSRLTFAGVELETSRAILEASRGPIANQITVVHDVVHEIEPEDRGVKGATGAIPGLIARRTEALEFRLGRGGYYVGSAVANYLGELSSHAFFRYVLVFDERGGLFGMFDDDTLVSTLQHVLATASTGSRTC